MAKCLVSGCPNRAVAVNQTVLNRPKKRFFHFPKDPARVKVWLAALRETDKQDLTVRRLICEDHFLPEDISKGGVKSDAIPIMPPYLDGPLGPSSSWRGESSEEEEKCEDEEESVEDAAPAAAQPPAPDPPRQVRQLQRSPSAAGFGPYPDRTNPGGENPADALKTRAVVQHVKQSIQPKKAPAKTVPVGRLTQQLLELLLVAPDGSLDLRQAITSLQTRRCRVLNIINVLQEINLVQKESLNRIRWIGKSPVSSFLWKNQQRFRREMDKMRLVEDALDAIIETCAHQLFGMTDDAENSASAYVTHDDINRLKGFEEQTVIVIRAPEETKLEIPSPKEDSIQVHLKAEKGPITVLTADLGSGDSVTSEPKAIADGFFLTPEESRIGTTLLTESSGPKSAVQNT